MAEAPLPETLPGGFFVLEWDRDRHVFILHTQDEDFSSFNLGGDIQRVRFRFKMWKRKELGDRAIDVAHEFGACKASLEDGRVVALFERSRERHIEFKEDDYAEGTLTSLRTHP